MDKDINDDCNGAMGNGDNNDTMDDDVNNNGDGVTEDYINNDNGDRTTNNNVKDNDYGVTDDNIDDNCDGATDGRHCLDVCGSCATKGDARWRHVTTGDATPSQQTRCKQEERRQRTRGRERERLCRVSCVAFLAM